MITDTLLPYPSGQTCPFPTMYLPGRPANLDDGACEHQWRVAYATEAKSKRPQFIHLLLNNCRTNWKIRVDGVPIQPPEGE